MNLPQLNATPSGVTSVAITSGGSGYTSAPTVIFSAPQIGGTKATGTAIISGGVVAAVTITNGGSGYTTTPTVTFAGGGGSGATATAVLTNNFTTVSFWMNWNGGSSAMPISFNGCHLS